MAVYVNIDWLDPETEAVYYSDRVKVSDTISYNRYIGTLKNLRFDDFYIILGAKNKVVNYINNSPKHKHFKAKIVSNFLPEIFIEPENKILDNSKK